MRIVDGCLVNQRRLFDDIKYAVMFGDHKKPILEPQLLQYHIQTPAVYNVCTTRALYYKKYRAAPTNRRLGLQIVCYYSICIPSQVTLIDISKKSITFKKLHTCIIVLPYNVVSL